ncbi:hypothetical protein PENSPDRAFT_692349 [Peniophora sp. CONT]|nr:hypothetical protein PENSPDRAFT_692349 [Peniophora sp. CONT]
MLSLNKPVLLLFAASLATLVSGQDLTIPPDWRKPNSSRSRPERLSIAQAAIDSLVSAVNTTDGTTTPTMDVWTYANIPAAIAQHDYISGTQDNHGLVSNIIRGFRNTHDPAYFNSSLTLKQPEVNAEALAWGLAAFYGSRAYNDSDMLNTALEVWDVATRYSVSPEEGANGTQPTRNVSFPINCVANGALFNRSERDFALQIMATLSVTSVGAVFWTTDPVDLGCNGETVGAYVALSMHLWEAVGHSTYLDAAHSAAGFIFTHMYSQSENIIADTYNIGTCESNSLTWTYNQGFFLEGLSILSSAPVSDSPTWTNLLQTLIASTVKSPHWIASGDNAGVIIECNRRYPPSFNILIGVIADSSDPTVFQEAWVYRIAFTRGLYEVWSRTDPFSPMANLTQAFMMVQYNALLDLASNSGDYSPIWVGPTLQTRVP